MRYGDKRLIDGEVHFWDGQGWRRYWVAQGISDYLTFYTPDDIRGMLNSLKTSYDIVNGRAAGDTDWDRHYKEFSDFYARETSRWGFTYSQATVDAIRQRERELGLWQDRLAQRGQDPGTRRSPDQKETPGEDAVKGLAKVGAVVGAIWLISKVLRRSS